MTLIHKVKSYIAEHDLLPARSSLVVGVSGGADSLCLLHVLVQLRAPLELALRAAHLNHRLRGEESDADELYVRQIAEIWDVPLTVDGEDVASQAVTNGMGIEEAARQARYRFLGVVAGQVGAGTVCVGHNADDQAETVMMHLLRGSGLAGLQGMLPAAPYPMPDMKPTLARPLLDTPRAAIDAYCREHGLQPRVDQSNRDPALLRNRVRHQVLPELEQVSPGLRGRLCQLAKVAAADLVVLRQLGDDAWHSVACQESEDVIVLDIEAWQALPLSLRRSTLRQSWARLTGSLRGIAFSHVEDARKVAETGATGARATLPDSVELIVGYDRAVLSHRGAPARSPDERPILSDRHPVALAVPGVTALPTTCWQVQTQLLPRTPDTLAMALANDDALVAFLDADQAGMELELRPRRRGERFQPLGMGGKSSSVSDFMINCRLPAALRDGVPLLAQDPPPGDVAADGQILWIVGWRLDERCKITTKTARVLKVAFSRIEQCRSGDPQ